MEAVAAIIVTHNSEAVIHECVDRLLLQTGVTLSIIIVDSGSLCSKYLDKYTDNVRVTLYRTSNIGFSAANNIGFTLCPLETKFVAFINPDLFVQPQTLEHAILRLQQMPQVACLTAKLLLYVIERNLPTGRIDSTGIFRKFYGRWYDRGLGQQDAGQYDHSAFLPAACGGFLVCRREALLEAALPEGGIFDPDFFLYKEDIELSLRLRKHGWGIFYDPRLVVYHCRGWSKKRADIAYSLREMSARNEIVLYQKHPSVYVVWAVFKWLLVRVFKI